MTGKLWQSAFILATAALAAAAWQYAPMLLIFDAAADFDMLASLLGVFAALRLAEWIEGRLSGHP